MELAQEEKAARLQHAVLNSSVEELGIIYNEFGEIEMSAPALGLACRFRGLDVVKALVEKGATFDFPSTKKNRRKISLLYWKKVWELSHKLCNVSAQNLWKSFENLLRRRHENGAKCKYRYGNMFAVSL